MTGTYDNVSEGNTDHGIPEVNKDKAAVMESVQERHKPVQDYHCYMGVGKTFDYSNGSADSVYLTKNASQCQLMSNEPHATSKLGDDTGVEEDAVTEEFLSRGAEITKKCSYLQRVCKSKHIRICLSMSFVVNIVLILVVVLLATKTIHVLENEGENCDVQHLSKHVLHDSLCIPCNNLGSHVTADDTLFDTISTCGFKLCCVRNASIQNFFLLMLQEGYTGEANTKRHLAVNNNDLNRTVTIWNSRNKAAHLYANITSLPEKLTWTTDAGFGSAFLSGITLTQESRLMVPQAGYYFIYSAVTFRCQPHSMTHIHLINKQKKLLPNRGIQELLLSKSSVCGPDGFYTSFLSGVLHLTAKDEISVSVKDDSLSSVYASPLSNFFGVYLI
ncbi:hypothetical protein ACJMK2_009467 [Sinanodonta woodiana]|uniref:THD domain-containing protein n=1 Tax=Sinanodonta woodiana TaxID=1069815 RepID=A0ABD3VEP5_SINWO